MNDSIKIIALGLVIAAGMTTTMWLSSSSQELPASLTTEEISWVKFCNAHGYDVSDSSEDVVSEYLDSWVGSVEEEAALEGKEV